MSSRLALAASLVALASGCARTAVEGRVRDASAPPKTAFEVYPPDQIAGVKDPHDFRGKALCQRCHRPDLTLTKDANALCKECHTFSRGNHPVDVVQKPPLPKDLPLLAGGKVACHTCHDPHRKGKVLRKSFDQLCTTCHAKH